MNMYTQVLLQHTHPKKLVLEIVGSIWTVYFLWNQNWVGAVISGIAVPILGSIIVWKEPTPPAVKRSSFARVIMSHAHPINLTFHIIGTAILIYGLWMHNTVMLLVGVSIAILGHAWGLKAGSDSLQTS